MKINTTRLPAAMLMSAVILGACAEKTPQVETPVTQSVPMTEQSNVAGRAGMVYRAPDINYRQYTRFIVDPVQIYRGADANFGGASEQQIQEMADFMRSEMIRALGPRVTNTPGPNVARVKLTLAGLEGNTPVVSTVSHLVPVGLVANAAQAARGAPGSFTGSVTYAVEVADSQSGKPLIVGVQKRSPGALDIPATVTSEYAQKAAITSFAEAFRKRVDEIQSAAGSPRS